MNAPDKKLLKAQPDEVITYKRRINGKMTTVHKIALINKPFNDNTYWLVYNNKKTGTGTKTQVLNRLRKHIT